MGYLAFSFQLTFLLIDDGVFTSTPLTTLITNVAAQIGGVSGGAGDAGLKYNGVNSALNNFKPGGNLGDARPAAYLNYILFDKNYKVLDAGWQAPLDATAFTKQKLSFTTLNIKEAGFIYVYLSYDDDSDNWVYFDDFKVTYTPTNVIQYNEYYPFGLQTANSWTRDNSSNNFKYNEASELNNTSGLYDLPYRNYDAALGRFFQVDPLAHRDHSVSPFAYAGNNPVMQNDPSGLMVNYSDMEERKRRADERIQEAEMAAAAAHLWSDNAVFGGAGAWWGSTTGGGSLGSFGSRDLGSMQNLIDYANNLLASGFEGQAYGKDENGEYGYMYQQSTGAGSSSYKDGSTTVLNEFVVTANSVKNGADNQNFSEQLIDMVNFYFCKEYNNVKLPIDWNISNSTGEAETTRRNGRVEIDIPKSKFANPKLLYLTIGHELIHANDFNPGGYHDYFFGKTENDLEAKDEMEAIMEYHAYSWDGPMEQTLGASYGAMENLKSYRETLEYYSLFYMVNDYLNKKK